MKDTPAMTNPRKAANVWGIVENIQYKVSEFMLFIYYIVRSLVFLIHKYTSFLFIYNKMANKKIKILSSRNIFFILNISFWESLRILKNFAFFV
jgi:hypothetical protein